MPALYEIKPSPGKGNGVFATRNISQGTAILRDKLVMVIDQVEMHITEQAVSQAFDKLSRVDQRRFLQLHAADERRGNGGKSRLYRIYKDNAFGDEESHLEIIAEAPIAKGEEIYISYKEGALQTLTSRQRMSLLRASYGFVCSCPACSLDGASLRLSDMRRELACCLWYGLRGFQKPDLDAVGENILSRRKIVLPHKVMCGVLLLQRSATTIDLTTNTSANPLSEHDSYWRIDDAGRGIQRLQQDEKMLREELKRYCSMNHQKQTKKGEPASLLKRADHGLLCYVHCTVEELRQYIADRHITYNEDVGVRVVESGGPVRTGLYAMLEQADTEPEFHGFMELPPELRTEVYGYYIAGLAGNTLHAPTTPPLACVNRQIRKEVLPIFFGQPVRIRPETALFFNDVDGENLALVRKIRICVRSYAYQNTPREQAAVVCDVGIAQQGITFGSDCKYTSAPGAWRVNHELSGALRRLTSGENGAIKSMSWRDMQALSKAMERAWDF
ncbi:hypothetical protein LTR85_006689 [Meristemomyces frigidus]|nr:hypothetical protein LTR85_006689 [Meristemomyces frigidus]